MCHMTMAMAVDTPRETQQNSIYEQKLSYFEIWDLSLILRILVVLCRGSFYPPEIFQMRLLESWCARKDRQKNLSTKSMPFFLPPVRISKKSMFSEAPVEGKQKFKSWPIGCLEETVGGDRPWEF